MTSFPAEGDGVFNETIRGLPLSHLPVPAAGVVTINSDASIADALAVLAQAKMCGFACKIPR